MSRFFSFLRFFGFDFFVFKRSFFGLGFYFKDFLSLKKQSDKTFPFGKKYPVLNERFSFSGKTKGHYFNQDLYVAKKVFLSSPKKHVDVGSRIDGFVAHVAVFRKIEVFDVRPLESSFENISFSRLDLTGPLGSLSIHCKIIFTLSLISSILHR